MKMPYEPLTEGAVVSDGRSCTKLVLADRSENEGVMQLSLLALLQRRQVHVTQVSYCVKSIPIFEAVSKTLRKDLVGNRARAHSEIDLEFVPPDS